MFGPPAESSSTAFDFPASVFCSCQTPDSRRAGWVKTLFCPRNKEGPSERETTTAENTLDFSPHTNGTNVFHPFMWPVRCLQSQAMFLWAELGEREALEDVQEKIGDTAKGVCVWNQSVKLQRNVFLALLFLLRGELTIRCTFVYDQRWCLLLLLAVSQINELLPDCWCK